MIATQEKATIVLFEKSVKNGMYHGMVALACNHVVTYRTNSAFFITHLDEGWVLPCPACQRAS